MASQHQNGGRSPELRHDPVTNRWVIFSPARAKRPTDFKSKNPQNPNPNNNSLCPFCIGNEHECAPEIFRVPPDLNDPNWKLRVIENLYPALSRNLECPCEEKQGMEFPGRVIGGFGFHDVVIENPVHSVQLSDMEPREIGEVFLAHKKRIQQIMSVQSIKYVQVFFLLLFSEFVCVFGHVQSMSRFFSAFGDGFFFLILNL
jgi:UDPglucose--hexose-1-phosphate uridylyltransferase